MRQFTIPIKSLPPGLAGRIEVTETPAHRDWRDRAVSGAAILGTVLLVTPYAILLDPLGMVAGLGVLLYVVRVASDVRLYTPEDHFTMEAVMEFEDEARCPQECERPDPHQEVRHLQ